MLLWTSFAILSAVVLVALLRPLLAPAATPLAPEEAGREVYRDQLAEIDSDRAAGMIGEAEAEAAKRELARRLLAEAAGSAASSAAAAATGTGFARYSFYIAGIALLPALGLLIYQATGSPRLPSQPHDARVAQKPVPNSIDDLVARVEERLREHPEDGQGWDVLAPVYMRQERFREAADAFARAIRLLGPNAKRLSGFGEATVIAENGIVSEPARLAYEQLLKLEPGQPEARFWLAMAKEQDGKLTEAAADYRGLLADAPAGAPWRASVEERLALVTQRMGGAPVAPPAAGLGAAPSREGAKAIESLPPEERMKAISGMVDGLAARLKQNGDDLDGWLRLIRAYKVLGKQDAARASLLDARKAMQGNAAGQSALDTLAKDLGLGS